MPVSIRYFTKQQLIKANNLAIKRGYNRHMPKKLLRRLPNNLFFTVFYFFEHNHKRGEPCERHMRTGFVYDFNGSQGCIDCDWSLFWNLSVDEHPLPHEIEESQLDNQIPHPDRSSGNTLHV